MRCDGTRCVDRYPSPFFRSYRNTFFLHSSFHSLARRVPHSNAIKQEERITKSQGIKRINNTNNEVGTCGRRYANQIIRKLLAFFSLCYYHFSLIGSAHAKPVLCGRAYNCVGVHGVHESLARNRKTTK